MSMTRDEGHSPASRPSDHWEVVPSEYIPIPITQTLNRLDFDALEGHASRLRNGRPCKIDRNKFTFGGRNIIFEAQFDDDKIWIVRVRVFGGMKMESIFDRSLESEVASIKYIKRHTINVPVPDVYGHNSDFSNEAGSSYMFMESMAGKRLVGGGSKDFIPDEHKVKVYSQLADIILQLSALSFRQIGMLQQEEDGQEKVDAIVASDGTTFGPFSSSREYYLCRAELLSQNCGPHGGQDLDPSNVDCLRYRISHSLVNESPNGPFPLTHPDFSISNMLFDDDYNITALLDWSGVQTAPIQSFARPPVMVVPQPLKSRPKPLSKPEISRRQLFFQTFKEREAWYDPGTPITRNLISSRSIIAGILDDEAILGHDISDYKADLLAFVHGDDDFEHMIGE